MSRLLEDIKRAQKAWKQAELAEKAAAAQQLNPAVKAESPVPVAPVAGNPPHANVQQPTEAGVAADRYLELEQAAARRMQRDAEALEQLKRQSGEVARASEKSKSWLEVETQQLELAQALEAEHAKAALAAEAAAQLEEQAKQVAEQRLAAQARATDAAQRLQQAQERRADATRARLEAEKALTVAEVAHVVVEHNVDKIQEKQRAGNAELKRLRLGRYRRQAANLVRRASVGLVVLACAIGVGVSALVEAWRSASPNPAGHSVVQTGKGVRQDRPVLKMDRDLDAFAARANKQLLHTQKP